MPADRRILPRAMAVVAEEWAKHAGFIRLTHSPIGGTCSCGKPMALTEHSRHQEQQIALAVAAWARLTPPGTEDAVRHALEAERARAAETKAQAQDSGRCTRCTHFADEHPCITLSCTCVYFTTQSGD